MKLRIRNYSLLFGLVFSGLVMMLPAAAFAGLSLEGQLQPAGSRTASANQNVTLTLKIYDDEFSGQLLYAEKQKVPTKKEISLELGQGERLEGQPETGLQPDKLWLEVIINDAVMSPRLNLAELETRSDLRSDTGWALTKAGLRGATNSTITIGSDGITLNEIKAPLKVSGSLYQNGVIQATNTDSYGLGVSGEASGSFGTGVYGRASNTSNDLHFGGFFIADGNSGRGVYGYASNTSDTSSHYGGYFEAAGTYGKGVYGSASGSAGRGVYGCALDPGDVTNYGGYFFANGGNGRGVYAYGKAYSFYAGGGVGSTDYGTFTGGHDVRLAGDAADEIQPGMIVVCTGQVAVREEDGTPCLSSTMPTVTLATRAADKKIFGVLVRECPLPDDHWYKSSDDERFGIVNALGEGLVWVCDINGEIEAGDYITSSAVAGYGQLQDDDLVHSCTLGKATADVDWESVTDTVEYKGREVKIYLTPVVYTSG